MSSDPSDENKNLPPWLRGVPLPARPASLGARPEPARADPPSAPAQDRPQLPSWLSDAPETPPQVGAAALPSWLSDAPETPQDQPLLPDWLRALQPDAPPEMRAEPPPSRPSDSARSGGPAAARPPRDAELPEWLREAPQSDTQAAGSGALPSWLSEKPAPEPPRREPAARADETPEWLRSLAAETAAAESETANAQPLAQPDAPPAPAEEELPGWLSAGESQGLTGSMRADEIPDWLRTPDEPAAPPAPADLAPPSLPPEPPALPAQQSEAPPESETGIPDWLRDVTVDAADEEITAEPFFFDGATEAPESTSPAGPPAWLADAGETPDLAESMPDWLKESTSSSQDLSGTAPAAPERPLWLQDLEQSALSGAGEPAAPPDETQTTAPAEPAPDSESLSTEDMPPWLRASQAPPGPSDVAPAWLRADEAAPERTEDVPAWLSDAQPAQPESDDIPAWLRMEQPSPPPAGPEAAGPGDSAPPELAAPEPISHDDLPAWLRPTEVGPATPSADQEVPAWLRPTEAAPTMPAAGQEVPPWLRDEAGQPLPTAGAPGDTNLPAWLRGAQLESSAPPAAPAEQAPKTGFDWFEDQSAQPASQATPTSEEEELAGGIELPAWLRQPEPEPQKEISPADARSLDWLARLGVQEEEEESASVAPAVPSFKLPRPQAPARTAAQIEALVLLERLAATPFPEAAPAPSPAAPSLWRRMGVERLLYLVLLAAVVLALVVPAPSWLGLTAAPAVPGAADLFGQIDRLGQSDIVLIGYEWDARRSGELRPLEQAVIDHLIQRRVKLVLVSTDPQGTMLLFDLRDRLAAANYRGGGQDYILLGYKPGAELALRSLAQDFGRMLRSDFQGNDATLGALVIDLATGQPRLSQIGDLSMIMVLGDEPSDVQGWMEQVYPSARKPDGAAVPFGFLLPAEAAPIAQPYLTLPGIYHLAGKQGALAYQNLRGGAGMSLDQIATESAQQRLSSLVYIALFVLGAIVVGVAGALARRRRT
ncbi:MAG: hypothetical protein IPO81_30450 [Kouleothrix sp.]|nr:hypothetical protein [Kouleothrix sp.]